ncbi:MAG: helix-turn-helix transcriptional regulator [Sphingopyxis sp.]|nr:helix-turn-helix transcriptional regulator [Sphingopyxis sp.]
MTNFALLDLMIRGGSLALLALWSWVLVRDHRAQLAARVAVAMNASIAAHIIGTMAPPLGSNPLDPLFELGAVCVPALFWIFARTWFNDAARVGWSGWLAIMTSMVMVSLVLVSIEPRTQLFYVAAPTMRVLMFAFATLGLWEAWRGRDGDLVEERRSMRLALVGAVGAFVILTNAVEVLVYSDLAPDYWRSLIELGVLLLTFGFCAAMFNISQPLLFSAASTAPLRPRAALPEDDAIVARLRAHMQERLVWRDETLTIAALAAQLGEPEYRLRRAINGTLGHRNFAQFLNGYRLAEVKAALADPAQREVPILTIALDAGFGSLGPFNRAFREAEGMTPSEYRARAAG